MPRLAPSLFRRAGRISPHLATLLPACRTIESAQTELRWIRSHVLDSPPLEPTSQCGNHASPRYRARASIANPRSNLSSDRGRARLRDAEADVARLVARRGAGEPLQYVLGTQPFGDLEISCEKGVLIPRPETEAWASMLADLALSSSHSYAEEGRSEAAELRILDLCSGTGCIGLSLYARGLALRPRGRGGQGRLRVLGFDVEPRAVRLGRRNLRRNFHGSRPRGTDEAGDVVTFERADIFTDEWMASLDDKDNSLKSLQAGENSRPPRRRTVDILVSNPPYISQRGFATDTARSVRNHEPKLALVPSLSPSLFPPSTCAPEDIFYARLLEIADAVRPRVAAFEVGDMAQAIRVAEMAIARHYPGDSSQITGDKLAYGRWDVLEIWRDWPDCLPSDTEEGAVFICGRKVPVRGSGHGRVVFLSEGPIPRNRFTNRGFKQAIYTA